MFVIVTFCVAESTESQAAEEERMCSGYGRDVRSFHQFVFLSSNFFNIGRSIPNRGTVVQTGFIGKI